MSRFGITHGYFCQKYHGRNIKPTHENFCFYPKTVIIKGIDPSAIETIAYPAMRVFFSKAATILTDIFSCPDDDDANNTRRSYSSVSIPLSRRKMISDESVFRYIYAHRDLWIRLIHKTALFHNICLQFFADHEECGLNK